MKLTGTICEIGALEGEGGQQGVVLRRPDDTFVTVKGLTKDEVRALVPLFLDKVDLAVLASEVTA